MLLSLQALVEKYCLDVTGVIHCGAHLAEEAADYAKVFPGKPVWWIEANPLVTAKLLKTLKRYPGQRLIEALLWSEHGVTKDFNVTNYDGMSSSVFEFGTHTQFSPDTVYQHKLHLRTSTLDQLVVDYGIADCNFLNMDLQGAELAALQGATDLLETIRYVYTEINRVDVYVGCAKIWELDQLLEERGFKRVETNWVPKQGWGDGLYVKGAG